MTDRPAKSRANTSRPDEGEPGARSDAQVAGDLQMSREQMLDLGQKVLEHVVGRIEGLPGENAWEGEFRQVLEEQLLEDPPEDGRPADGGDRAGRRARFCRSRCATITPAPSASSRRRPPGPAWWPISWPPATKSTSAPGWSQADRASWSWSSSTGSGAGSAIRRARAASSPAAARRRAWMPSSRPARRRATPNAPAST